MRILIFGNSGSGKSTYAKVRAVHQRLPHLDLDSIVWEPAKIAVARDPTTVAADLDAFIDAHADWVIEGCYGELVQTAAAYCSELVFLNPGREACLASNAQRPWEPHKYASAAEQDALLENLQTWVAGYYQRDDMWSYRAHRRIFDAHVGNKTEHTSMLDLD